MRSMYDYIISRVEKLAEGQEPYKNILLKEYQHLIKTAVSHGDLDEVDAQYVNEIVAKTKIPNCPYCNGQREMSGIKDIFSCMFCGKTSR